jgi:hypothetical protein
MVKMVYIIAGAALVVALSVIGAIVYYQGGVPGLSFTAPYSHNTSGGSNVMITALQAFSIADKDSNVKNWKAGNNNVSVGQITSDFCADGLSDTWTITYASDTEEASAHVESGIMQGITVVRTAERLYPVQNTLVGGLIDSPKASDIAAGAMSSAGVSAEGPGSATLAFKTSGAPIWDMNYPLANGNYIARIDAASGNITESATIGR